MYIYIVQYMYVFNIDTHTQKALSHQLYQWTSLCRALGQTLTSTQGARKNLKPTLLWLEFD